MVCAGSILCTRESFSQPRSFMLVALRPGPTAPYVGWAAMYALAVLIVSHGSW